MINIYTDGACSGNPGPGGWAHIIKYDGQQIASGSGGVADTTNNRMEMQAVISGLKDLDTAIWLHEFNSKASGSEIKIAPEVTVITDSTYVQKGMTEWIEGWKAKDWKNSKNKPVLNKDLWLELDKVANKKYNVKFKHIRGHQGHPENEECDRMAVAAYQKYK